MGQGFLSFLPKSWLSDKHLEEVCRKVNDGAVLLPDGRRLVVAVGKRLRTCLHAAPLANTG